MCGAGARDRGFLFYICVQVGFDDGKKKQSKKKVFVSYFSFFFLQPRSAFSTR